MAKFKTRARAIDMLGRQQIAGIPTAINELFKNAHDAYADNVEVDYFRKEKTLLIRDNGYGMSLKDFLSRWLVLGTESKVDGVRKNLPSIPKNKKARPILGEKGIGRLSVAAIGQQVLIISRAQKEDETLCPIVCALIHWGLFEIPGIDLDQIDLPVKEFTSSPSSADIAKMQEELKMSIIKLVDDNVVFAEEAERILLECEASFIDPVKLYEQCPTVLSLENNTGTHFIISPVNDSLNDSIDADLNDKDSAPKLEKFLIGFSNTMTPDHPTPVIEAAFRDHYAEGLYNELIDKDAFFTPDDFVSADHHFCGSFDEFGQFSGKVTVYNQHTLEHKIPWNGNNFRPTACGTFQIECSYLQGTLRQSTLDPISHAAIRQKLDKYGGLYIYKDGIRILPYGNNDYDFLDIELNRTKSASYYFFSYRRIFGVINISRQANPALVEKAGREGLIENKAYKQMRDILKNFFVQLAADFFRETDKGGGVFVEYWEDIRKERERIFRAQQRRQKQVAYKKEQFIKSLNLFFDKYQQGYWQTAADDIISSTQQSLDAFIVAEDIDTVANQLIAEEGNVRQRLNQLRDEAKLKSAHGFAINREQRENWEAYLELSGKIEGDVFLPLERKLTDLFSDIKNRLSIAVSNRKRVQQSLDIVSNNAKAETSEKRKQAKKAAGEIAQKVRGLTQDLMERLENSVRDAQSNLTTLGDDILSDSELISTINKVEAPIIAEKDYATGLLESIISQLENIFWEKDDTGKIVTNQNIADSLEEEIGELRKKAQSDAELIQLGLAVNIVHHEFANAVKALRGSIRNLRDKATMDKTLQVTYNNLRTNFSHLDHYLSLLTPFSRRIVHEKENIATEDIFLFMLDVFKGRLQRHGIECRRTGRFAQSQVLSYRSILYPVFANLVDNAIHWLKQKADEIPKAIRLHMDEGGAFYVSNNGPAIPIQDWERIFELGFSRKPSGRGMGLPISRDVLKGIGYSLELCQPRDEDMTVSFKITPISDTGGGNAK
jgi:signal transduction histidine kinase